MNENQVICDLVYGVVLQPLTLVVKELRYRGLTETMLKDLVLLAVDKGLEEYESEKTKANTGH